MNPSLIGPEGIHHAPTCTRRDILIVRSTNDPTYLKCRTCGGTNLKGTK